MMKELSQVEFTKSLEDGVKFFAELREFLGQCGFTEQPDGAWVDPRYPGNQPVSIFYAFLIAVGRRGPQYA